VTFLGRKEWPVRKDDNLTEPTVETMWDPQRLPTLGASTAYYGEIFTFLFTSRPLSLAKQPFLYPQS
jgi:hypothetical protein